MVAVSQVSALVGIIAKVPPRFTMSRLMTCPLLLYPQEWIHRLHYYKHHHLGLGFVRIETKLSVI